MPRLTVPSLRLRKHGEKIVALTCYTAPMARLLDPHVDILLVGDSLGMTVYGMTSTLAVTLDTMIAHGRAVVAHAQNACVIVDLPFGSYQESPAQAFRSAGRVMAETGAQGVKLEGGAEIAETVAFLSARGVPVMGHVGLKPQYHNVTGGYRYQGRNPEDRARILSDAAAVEAAGAFAVVLEAVEESLAREITKKLSVPTIGIGASADCDGQVLVTEDLLGLTENAPKFAKCYANAATLVSQAAAAYVKDVRSRTFPAREHCFMAPTEKKTKKQPK